MRTREQMAEDDPDLLRDLAGERPDDSAGQGPVQCAECGWTDDGDLILESTPAGLLLYGDEGMPVTTCGGCDRDLDEYEVVPAPRPLPGVLRRYRDAVRGRGDARADLRDEMQEWGADE